MAYLMGGQVSELDRLQLQSRVWEPAGRALLEEIGDGRGLRVLDVGCGCYGWLPPLADWVGATGTVVGTDVDSRLLDAARELVAEQGLGNVEVTSDDLFASALEPHSFDLVHARFQLAPLGRMDEQLAAFLRLVRPGGVLVLEDPDTASWSYQPEAPALRALIEAILPTFRRAGGDFDAGRQLPALLAGAGITPSIRADVVALPAGHPYLALPVQFATSLRPRLLEEVAEETLDAWIAAATEEAAAPDRWGLTFTLVQAWGHVPADSATRSVQVAPTPGH